MEDFAALKADLAELERFYDCDKVAHPQAIAIERIFDRWLHDGTQPVQMDCETAAIQAFVQRVNARAEAQMLTGRPIAGAHHRAIEAELALLAVPVPHQEEEGETAPDRRPDVGGAPRPTGSGQSNEVTDEESHARIGRFGQSDPADHAPTGDESSRDSSRTEDDPRSLDDLPRCPRCRSADILLWNVAGWRWRCGACEDRFGEPFVYSAVYPRLRAQDTYRWGETMSQCAVLGIGAHAWVELEQEERRTITYQDTAGVRLSASTLRLVLRVLRAIRLRDFSDAALPSSPDPPPGAPP